MSAQNFESPTEHLSTTEQSDILAAWDHVDEAVSYACEVGIVYDSGPGYVVETPSRSAIAHFSPPKYPYNGQNILLHRGQGNKGVYSAECLAHEDGTVSVPLVTVTRNTRRSPDHHFAKDLIRYEHTFQAKHRPRAAALIISLAAKRTAASADKAAENIIAKTLAAQQNYHQTGKSD